MHAIELLKLQHLRTRALLAALEETQSLPERHELLRQTAGEITRHTILEETHFYGSVCQVGLEELTHAARHAHEDIKYKLEALCALPIDSPAFAEHVHALAVRIREHTQDEERVLFPQALALCNEQQLLDIARAMNQSAHVWDSNEPSPGL